MQDSIRSIGINIMDKDKFELFIKDLFNDYDIQYVYNEKNSKDSIVQKIKYYGDDFGVFTVSKVDANDNVSIKVVQPYFETSFMHVLKNIKISKIDESLYVGYGVEEYTNVSICFYIQNNMSDILESKKELTGEKDVKLYAVSSGSKVILPNEIKKVARQDFLSQVLDLDSSMLESLNDELKNVTEEIDNKIEMIEKILSEYKIIDIDTIKEDLQLSENEILKSLQEPTKKFPIIDNNEDVDITNLLERIEQYIHYIGQNYYEFLGTISSVEVLKNNKTNEEIYKMVICVSGIYIDILINKKDLYGVPYEGMRILGKFMFYGEILKDVY